jgi:hypothetical protein
METTLEIYEVLQRRKGGKTEKATGLAVWQWFNSKQTVSLRLDDLEY